MEEAHRAAADDGDVRAGADGERFDRVEDAGEGLEERAKLGGDGGIDGQKLAHRDERRGNADVLRDGPVEVVAEGLALGAAVAEAVTAEGAASAAEDRTNRDDLVQREVDAGPDLSDLAGEFVAGDDAGRGLLLAEIDAHVAVAEAGCVNLEHDLAGAGVRFGHVDDANLAGFEESQGFHGATVRAWRRCEIGSSCGDEQVPQVSPLMCGTYVRTERAMSPNNH